MEFEAEPESNDVPEPNDDEPEPNDEGCVGEAVVELPVMACDSPELLLIIWGLSPRIGDGRQ